MEMQHLFRHDLFADLFRHNIISPCGFVKATHKDLDKYDSVWQERSSDRTRELFKERKSMVDKADELIKDTETALSQNKPLNEIVESLGLEFGDDDMLRVREFQIPQKRRSKKVKSGLNLWERQAIAEDKRIKILRWYLLLLDNWLRGICKPTTTVLKPAYRPDVNWKIEERNYRQRTLRRMADMKRARYALIRNFHAMNETLRIGSVKYSNFLRKIYLKKVESVSAIKNFGIEKHPPSKDYHQDTTRRRKVQKEELYPAEDAEIIDTKLAPVPVKFHRKESCMAETVKSGSQVDLKIIPRGKLKLPLKDENELNSEIHPTLKDEKELDTEMHPSSFTTDTDTFASEIETDQDVESVLVDKKGYDEEERRACIPISEKKDIKDSMKTAISTRALESEEIKKHILESEIKKSKDSKDLIDVRKYDEDEEKGYVPVSEKETIEDILKGVSSPTEYVEDEEEEHSKDKKIRYTPVAGIESSEDTQNCLLDSKKYVKDEEEQHVEEKVRDYVPVGETETAEDNEKDLIDSIKYEDAKKRCGEEKETDELVIQTEPIEDTEKDLIATREYVKNLEKKHVPVNKKGRISLSKSYSLEEKIPEKPGGEERELEELQTVTEKHIVPKDEEKLLTADEKKEVTLKDIPEGQETSKYERDLKEISKYFESDRPDTEKLPGSKIKSALPEFQRKENEIETSYSVKVVSGEDICVPDEDLETSDNIKPSISEEKLKDMPQLNQQTKLIKPELEADEVSTQPKIRDVYTNDSKVISKASTEDRIKTEANEYISEASDEIPQEMDTGPIRVNGKPLENKRYKWGVKDLASQYGKDDGKYVEEDVIKEQEGISKDLTYEENIIKTTSVEEVTKYLEDDEGSQELPGSDAPEKKFSGHEVKIKSKSEEKIGFEVMEELEDIYKEPEIPSQDDEIRRAGRISVQMEKGLKLEFGKEDMEPSDLESYMIKFPSDEYDEKKSKIDEKRSLSERKDLEKFLAAELDDRAREEEDHKKRLLANLGKDFNSIIVEDTLPSSSAEMTEIEVLDYEADEKQTKEDRKIPLMEPGKSENILRDSKKVQKFKEKSHSRRRTSIDLEKGAKLIEKHEITKPSTTELESLPVEFKGDLKFKAAKDVSSITVIPEEKFLSQEDDEKQVNRLSSLRDVKDSEKIQEDIEKIHPPEESFHMKRISVDLQKLLAESPTAEETKKRQPTREKRKKKSRDIQDISALPATVIHKEKLPTFEEDENKDQKIRKSISKEKEKKTKERRISILRGRKDSEKNCKDLGEFQISKERDHRKHTSVDVEKSIKHTTNETSEPAAFVGKRLSVENNVDPNIGLAEKVSTLPATEIHEEILPVVEANEMEIKIDRKCTLKEGKTAEKTYSALKKVEIPGEVKDRESLESVDFEKCSREKLPKVPTYVKEAKLKTSAEVEEDRHLETPEGEGKRQLTLSQLRRVEKGLSKDFVFRNESVPDTDQDVSSITKELIRENVLLGENKINGKISKDVTYDFKSKADIDKPGAEVKLPKKPSIQVCSERVTSQGTDKDAKDKLTFRKDDSKVYKKTSEKEAVASQHEKQFRKDKKYSVRESKYVDRFLEEPKGIPISKEKRELSKKIKEEKRITSCEFQKGHPTDMLRKRYEQARDEDDGTTFVKRTRAARRRFSGYFTSYSSMNLTGQQQVSPAIVSKVIRWAKRSKPYSFSQEAKHLKAKKDELKYPSDILLTPHEKPMTDVRFDEDLTGPEVPVTQEMILKMVKRKKGNKGMQLNSAIYELFSENTNSNPS